VVSVSECGVWGACRFKSHHGRLCLSRQPLRYAVVGTGCAPLLQCLVNSALHPSVVAKSSTSFGWVVAGNIQWYPITQDHQSLEETASRLWFEPGHYCAWVQHANQSHQSLTGWIGSLTVRCDYSMHVTLWFFGFRSSTPTPDIIFSILSFSL